MARGRRDGEDWHLRSMVVDRTEAEEEEVGQLWDQEEGFPHFSRFAPSYFLSLFLVLLNERYL